MRRLLGTVALLTMSACIEMPDVGVPVPELGEEPDYPKLVNLRTLELNAAEKDAEALRTEQETAARVARLRARAAELRRSEIN